MLKSKDGFHPTLSEDRLSEIMTDPASATPEEVAALGAEAGRWRTLRPFLFESLKALFLSNKETAEPSLLTKVTTDIARTCMRRIKEI